MTPYMDVIGVEEGAELARKIHEGDGAAEARFARLYCDCVLAMALARTRDRDAARELVDDVLMAVIMALRHGTVRDCSRLGGFVHGTAINTINGYFRRRRHESRTVRLDPDFPLADAWDDYSTADRQRLARDSMALLAPRDWAILYLSLAEGLKPGEIASRLGLSPMLVRQRKCRALRAIVVAVSDGAPGHRARRMLRR